MPEQRVEFRIRTVFAVLALIAAGIAISAVVVSLPNPAVGGTCGPGRGSEAAIEAFFNPASIGAGAAPPVSDTAAFENRLAFIGECQASTDARMLIGLSLLVASALLAFGGPALTLRLRRRRASDGGSVTIAPAGWYPDPASPGSGSSRWWDGEAWGDTHPPPEPLQPSEPHEDVTVRT